MAVEFQGEGKYDSQWDAWDDGYACQAERVNAYLAECPDRPGIMHEGTDDAALDRGWKALADWVCPDRTDFIMNHLVPNLPPDEDTRALIQAIVRAVDE